MNYLVNKKDKNVYTIRLRPGVQPRYEPSKIELTPVASWIFGIVIFGGTTVEILWQVWHAG